MDAKDILRSPVFPLGANGIPRQPTEAEKTEVEILRGMQVRKDAANFAAIVYHGTATDHDTVLDLAAKIANFIAEG